MSHDLDTLVKQIALKAESEHVFLGESSDIFSTGRIFGGQVLGQAVMAASYTVTKDRPIHSMHAYFIRPGDTRVPIRFEVETVRDGGSFSVRRVLALQHDKPIFSMGASFQVPETGFEHADKMPAGIPAPEDCLSESEATAILGEAVNSDYLRERAKKNKPIDIRVVNRELFANPGHYEPKGYYWFKASKPVDTDPLLQKGLLAYTSDFYFLFASLMPHNCSPFDLDLQKASLDHAIWFHRPFDLNDWLLYSIESPNASAGRGLVRGQVFNRQGQLVVSVTQEGLIRKR